MKYRELKAMREEILRLRAKAPAHKGARRISRDVMRAIRNEREDLAAYLKAPLRPVDNWDVPERYVKRMNEALDRAYREVASEIFKLHKELGGGDDFYAFLSLDYFPAIQGREFWDIRHKIRFRYRDGSVSHKEAEAVAKDFTGAACDYYRVSSEDFLPYLRRRR